jgi:hypothetical protein
VIAEYAESLASRLALDPALARSVRQEVEDHLWEAAGDGSPEAQRRAIARFGDARLIAEQLAAEAVFGRARRTALALVLALAGIFLAMKARLAWYALTQWGVCEQTRSLGEALAVADRSAFWLAAAAAIAAGWAYRGRLFAFFCLCAVTGGAVLTSVVCDAALTWLRLAGWEWSAYFAVPLATMAVEVACAAVLLAHLRTAPLAYLRTKT